MTILSRDAEYLVGVRSAKRSTLGAIPPLLQRPSFKPQTIGFQGSFNRWNKDEQNIDDEGLKIVDLSTQWKNETLSRMFHPGIFP